MNMISLTAVGFSGHAHLLVTVKNNSLLLRRPALLHDLWYVGQ